MDEVAVSQEGFPSISDGKVIEFDENGKSAEIMQSLENLIRADLSELKNIDEDIKRNKEMIDGVLGNDETYKKHLEAAKEATRVKSNTKKEILKRPDVKHIAEKLKELRETKKGVKEELSSYGVEWMSHAKQLTLDFGEGEMYQVVQSAELKRVQ